MAQSTLLAAGHTAATSTDLVVAAGAFATIGVFSAAVGRLAQDGIFTVMQDTPGVDNNVTTLDNTRRSVVLIGPGTFRVTRTAYTGTDFGVFGET